MAGGTYDNTNRGALFKNDRKQRDNQPDYTGKMELGADVIAAAQNGDPIFVSGWLKTINTGQRAGEKMLSLSIQPPRENQAPRDNAPQQQQRPAQQARARAVQNGKNAANPISNDEQFKDDDIPF
jgi:single-stranded DNA-binding protein